MKSEGDLFYDTFYSGCGGEVDACQLMLRFFGDDLEPELFYQIVGRDADSSAPKGRPQASQSTNF
jgi:hypothetical protein